MVVCACMCVCLQVHVCVCMPMYTCTHGNIPQLFFALLLRQGLLLNLKLTNFQPAYSGNPVSDSPSTVTMPA